MFHKALLISIRGIWPTQAAALAQVHLRWQPALGLFEAGGSGRRRQNGAGRRWREVGSVVGQPGEVEKSGSGRSGHVAPVWYAPGMLRHVSII